MVGDKTGKIGRIQTIRGLTYYVGVGTPLSGWEATKELLSRGITPWDCALKHYCGTIEGDKLLEWGRNGIIKRVDAVV